MNVQGWIEDGETRNSIQISIAEVRLSEERSKVGCMVGGGYPILFIEFLVSVQLRRQQTLIHIYVNYSSPKLFKEIGSNKPFNSYKKSN